MPPSLIELTPEFHVVLNQQVGFQFELTGQPPQLRWSLRPHQQLPPHTISQPLLRQVYSQPSPIKSLVLMNLNLSSQRFQLH